MWDVDPFYLLYIRDTWIWNLYILEKVFSNYTESLLSQRYKTDQVQELSLSYLALLPNPICNHS